MRVGRSGGVSGKMFAAAGDPLFSHCIVERGGISNNLLDRFSVTTAAQRIVGVIGERDVQHRAKIEIKTKQPQQSPGDVAVTADKIDIVLVAKLLSVWRLAADQAQARHAPAFLIDGNDRLALAQIAQVVDEFAKLCRALDVAPKENKTPGLHSPEDAGAFRVEHFTRHTCEYQLTERI